jgi:apolipoprotein N-acyltransferase
MFKRIRRFILPDDLQLRKRRFELLIWSFVLSLAYYPGWFGFLAWFALVRPFMIISSLEGRESFNASYFFGFFFMLFSLYWVGMVSPPGMIAAVTIIGFYYAGMFAVFRRLYGIKPLYGMIALPFLWAGIEYFRTLSEFAFPWSELGYTQSYYLYVIQIVSVISVHGLSLLIVAVNVLLWQLLRVEVSAPKKVTAILTSCAVIVGLVAFGWVVVPPYPKEGTVKVSLLQGSVPLDVKWDIMNVEKNFELYDSLIGPNIDSSVSLYIWPETAAPCYLADEEHCLRRVGEIVERTGSYHLVGALALRYVEGKRRYFNSCFQLTPSGEIDAQHDKINLVPFAETVPYQDHIPFLQSEFLRKYLTFIETWGIQWWSDFYPGDSLHLFHIPQATYTTLICFESAFGEVSREATLRGAQFLVGITNDTWFGKSLGTTSHSRIFVTRMIENRMWGARVANSGLSYIVDPYGRIRENIGLYEISAKTGSVGLIDEFSLYTQYGNIAGRTGFLILVGLAGIFSFVWLIRRVGFYR